MRCLVFVALIAAGYAAPRNPFTWSDCGTHAVSRPIEFNFLAFSPNPVLFPGNLTVSTIIAINRPITALYADVVLTKKSVLGTYIELPCFGDTHIGTCQNYDLCTFLHDMMSDDTSVRFGYGDFNKQVQIILAHALGTLQQCPLQPANIIMRSETIQLDAMAVELSTIADGYYSVKMTLKESPSSTEMLGCLQFHVGVERANSNGFLFG